MSHTIELKFYESSNKYRAIVKPVDTDSHYLAIYESDACWRVLEACENNGFETVGHIEPIQEVLPEQLVYWGVSQEEFDQLSLCERLEIVTTLIRQDGEPIRDPQDHKYGDENLIGVICAFNTMTAAEWEEMSLGAKHAIQRNWVKGF